MFIQDEQSTIGLFHYSLQEWNFLGKSCSHFHPICDVLFITSNLSHQKLVPRLISLGQDRVSFHTISLSYLISDLFLLLFFFCTLSTFLNPHTHKHIINLANC